MNHQDNQTQQGRRTAPLPFLLCLLTVSAVATLTACTPSNTQPSPPAPSATLAAPTPTPSEDGPCQNHFTAQIEWGTDSAAPNSAYITLTNAGETVCTLTGFPSETAFLGDSGPIETLGYESSPTADAYGRAGVAVTVPPGGHAYIWAKISQTANRETPCEFPVATAGVTLVLPGGSAPVVAPTHAEVCLDTDSDDLQVGPVDSQPRPASAGG
ncbi:DUF4232 domain-containing protein [Agromyces bauzanensis]